MPKKKAENIDFPSVENIETFIRECGSEDLEVFGGTYAGGVCSQQIPDELAPCIYDLLKMGVKINSYLEVGAAAGGTTYIFDYYFNPKQIVLLDNNEHPKYNLRPEILKGIEYREIIGDSQSESASVAAREFSPYDFIILDAVHTYQATKIDVALYGPMLSKGGYLFLHDSVWSGGKVDRVVRELKTEKGWEFIGEYITKVHKNPCGIALFRKV